MIRKRAETDTVNPPGSFRPPKYLRDIIARIEDEEGKPVATFNVSEAPTPLPDAENASRARFEALTSLVVEQSMAVMDTKLYKTSERLRQEAEAKLEALKQALLRVCDTADGNPLYNGGHGISSALIRKLVAESS